MTGRLTSALVLISNDAAQGRLYLQQHLRIGHGYLHLNLLHDEAWSTFPELPAATGEKSEENPSISVGTRMKVTACNRTVPENGKSRDGLSGHWYAGSSSCKQVGLQEAEIPQKGRNTNKKMGVVMKHEAWCLCR
ncbi:hypothetical protein NDU88_004747 [Pleurodeles waltl]|uniref:Uncharacterized protein n=1 Tax=Pleurodeles waltl TaxID=8319 RepID=A0AAV7LMA3_PLEWA|nr:hypothetical protein NDU88_004747 [Pleurodeles waltl]